MWLCLNDAFLSVVHKDCKQGELLVRARRPGDIERVFGRRVRVTRATDADYLYRAVVSRSDVEEAMTREVARIDYGNFKNSVRDHDLHHAYMDVWTAMSKTQDPPPYSTPWTCKNKTDWKLPPHTESIFADRRNAPLTKADAPLAYDAGVDWDTAVTDEQTVQSDVADALSAAVTVAKKRGRPLGSTKKKGRGKR